MSHELAASSPRAVALGLDAEASSHAPEISSKRNATRSLEGRVTGLRAAVTIDDIVFDRELGLVIAFEVEVSDSEQRAALEMRPHAPSMLVESLIMPTFHL